VREIEVLNTIRQKLDETRNLAIEAGAFTLFYMIQMAIMETNEMSKKLEVVRNGTHELDGLKAH
jgi:hypothetical protein